MTPKNETPEIARAVPSLAELDDGALPEPVAVAPDAGDLLVAKAEPVGLADEAAVTVGRPVKSWALVNVLQLDEEGTRAV